MSFKSHQHLLGQTDKGRGHASAARGSGTGKEWSLPFVSVILSLLRRPHSRMPLAAMSDSISDTHPEHGLSLEKCQRLILSSGAIHAQPSYSQTQCSQERAVSHQ